MATGKFKQGLYTLKNPDKYIGDPNKVVYRSSWELNLHGFFDNNTNVIQWGSEIVCIPYIKPTDGRIHRYYPDYFVEYVTPSGELIKELIELKPNSQTKMSRSKNVRHRLYENLTFAVNSAKWAAAEDWCKLNNIKWRIVTEQHVYR